MNDAKFEDGSEAPLNLGAMDADDLQIVSTLAQDAVFPVTEMKWQPAERRFALLINRFRWEDLDAAQVRGREFERVQSLLVFDQVNGVASQGIDRADQNLILSLLSIDYDALAGQVKLILAGDGGLRLNVEALEVMLKDVTRPYRAASRHVPEHKV